MHETFLYLCSLYRVLHKLSLNVVSFNVRRLELLRVKKYQLANYVYAFPFSPWLFHDTKLPANPNKKYIQ